MEIKREKNKTVNKGFTLIELLVVVLIIGILAAIALPQYRKVVYKAKFTRATLMLNSIYKAQQEYFAVHGRYANDFSSLNMDLPPTDGTPTNYAYWDWGYCMINSAGYGGCGFEQARKLTRWSSNLSTCYAVKTNDTAQKICQAATGKTEDQRTTISGDYVYSFQ